MSVQCTYRCAVLVVTVVGGWYSDRPCLLLLVCYLPVTDRILLLIHVHVPISYMSVCSVSFKLIDISLEFQCKRPHPMKVGCLQSDRGGIFVFLPNVVYICVCTCTLHV